MQIVNTGIQFYYQPAKQFNYNIRTICFGQRLHNI
jgi:hypothetical protein